MISEAKLAANRRNALKGGVKTREGKMKSRMNALKHGQRAEVVLPADVQGEVDAKFAQIVDEIRPEGTVETGLARRMATEFVKLERLEKEEHAALAARIREVGAAVEEEQTRRVEACMQLMAHEPARAVRCLLATSAGCNWLLGEWATLRDRLEGGTWGEVEDRRAWHLLGGHDLGPDRAATIAEEVAAVESERDAVWEELDGPLRQEAEDRALLDTSKAGQLRSRYEGQAARQLHKVVDQYCKLRNGDPEPKRRPRPRRAPNEPTAETLSSPPVATTETVPPSPLRGEGRGEGCPHEEDVTPQVRPVPQAPSCEAPLEDDRPSPRPSPRGGEGGTAPNEPTAEPTQAPGFVAEHGSIRREVFSEAMRPLPPLVIDGIRVR